MAKLNDIKLAFSSYREAFELMFTKKFWYFLLIPLLVSVLLLLFWNAIAGVGSDFFYSFLDAKLSQYDFWNNIDGIIKNALDIIIRVFFFFLFASMGGYVVLFIMSPVFSILSEKTENYINGSTYKFEFKRFLWETFRGIVVALRNMFLQTLVTLSLLVLTFVPLMGFFTPILIFISSSYFYGLSFADYAMERKRISIGASFRYLNSNFALVCLLGAVFALCLYIPYFSFIICSFFSLFSAMASTIAIEKKMLNRPNCNKIQL